MSSASKFAIFDGKVTKNNLYNKKNLRQVIMLTGDLSIVSIANCLISRQGIFH